MMRKSSFAKNPAWSNNVEEAHMCNLRQNADIFAIYHSPVLGVGPLLKWTRCSWYQFYCLIGYYMSIKWPNGSSSISLDVRLQESSTDMQIEINSHTSIP